MPSDTARARGPEMLGLVLRLGILTRGPPMLGLVLEFEILTVVSSSPLGMVSDFFNKSAKSLMRNTRTKSPDCIEVFQLPGQQYALYKAPPEWQRAARLA